MFHSAAGMIKKRELFSLVGLSYSNCNLWCNIGRVIALYICTTTRPHFASYIKRFEEEVCNKYPGTASFELLNCFQTCFDALPLCSVIQVRINVWLSLLFCNKK